MDLDAFLRERQPRWNRLSKLLDRVDLVSLSGLTPDQADELFALYRLVSSDLNLVQTRTGNPALLEFLEGLVGRAYANLSVPRRAQPFRVWWQIVRHRFPARMRSERGLLGLATTAFVAGVVFAFLVTLVSPQSTEVFLPLEHLNESPSERVAKLEAMEQQGETRIDSASAHAVFSTFLFTHNIKVMVMAFAFGFTFGIGTIVVLFVNGAMLGSIAAYYLEDGVMLFFLGWVGPHGAIELPCILFGAAAGLMISRAQFRRDSGTFRVQLRELRPAMVEMVIGTASLLVVAGIIEGGFSQINEPTIPYLLKIAVAATLFVSLLCYLFIMPVESPAPDRNEEE